MNSRKILLIAIIAAALVAALLLLGRGTDLRDRMIEDLQSADGAARLDALKYFAGLDDPMAKAFTALMCGDSDPLIRHTALTRTAEDPSPGLMAPVTAAFDAGRFSGDSYSMRVYARLLALFETPDAADRIMKMAARADQIDGAVLSGSLASLRSFDGAWLRKHVKNCSGREFDILSSAVSRTRNPGLVFEMLRNCDKPQRRDPAFRMVREVGMAAVSLLPPLYETVDQAFKLRIISTIGQFGNGDVDGILRKALESGAPPVRREALRAAIRLGNEGAVSELARFANSFLESGDAALAQDALALVEKAGASQSVPEIMKGYYLLSAPMKERLLKSLSASGSPLGIKKFLNSTSPSERLTMARNVSRAYGPIPPDAAVEKVIKDFAAREFDRSVMLGFLDSLVSDGATWGAGCIADWRYLTDPELKAAIARLDAAASVPLPATAATASPESRTLPVAWIDEFSDPSVWKAWVDDFLAPRYGYDPGCDLTWLSSDHLWDPDRETRRRAIAYALNRKSDGIGVVLTLLLDGDPRTAEDAAAALSFMDSRAVPYLTQAVEGAFPARAASILQAASKMKSAAGRSEVLASLGRHHDGRIRSAATEAAEK